MNKGYSSDRHFYIYNAITKKLRKTGYTWGVLFSLELEGLSSRELLRFRATERNQKNYSMIPDNMLSFTSIFMWLIYYSFYQYGHMVPSISLTLGQAIRR